MIQALIFDFDGLILDTEMPVYQSWQEVYKSYGCTLSFAEWSTTIGSTDGDFDPLSNLEDLIAKKLDHKTLDQKRIQRELELIAHQPILPGVTTYLEDAKKAGLKLGVASSSSCKWVNQHLARLDLIEYFDSIICKDDVKRTKPDPALFLKALSSLGIQADQAVVFEDSPNGILAAKRAGIFCVAVPNTLTAQLPIDQADVRLVSLADRHLTDLLSQINDTI